MISVERLEATDWRQDKSLLYVRVILNTSFAARFSLKITHYLCFACNSRMLGANPRSHCVIGSRVGEWLKLQ